MPSPSSSVSHERLLSSARGLPASPIVLARLGNLLQDINSEIDSITHLLRQDASLSLRVLRMSNSAAFSYGRPVGSIDEAVCRLGLGEIYRLVGLAAMARLCERELVCYQLEAEPLRQHMIYTATAAETLAERCGVNTRTAYTAGLLRIVGMVILDRCMRDVLKPEQYFDSSRHPSYTQWEGQVFGITNYDVAALILEEWHFPPETVQAIRLQKLRAAESGPSQLACLLDCASYLSLVAGWGMVGDNLYPEDSLQKMERIGFGIRDLELIRLEVDRRFSMAQSLAAA